MTSLKRRRSVIKDLLALYQRYSSEEIEQAALSLKNGEALGEFADLTIQLTKQAARTDAPSRIANRKKKTRREYLDDLISDLEARSDQDAGDLIEFLKSASRGMVLNDVRSLREFVARLDIIEDGTKLDRFASLKRIGEALLAKPIPERAELIELAKHLEKRPSSLQGWSDLIVKK
jgi:hypothetical protein